MRSPDTTALAGLAPWIGGKRNLARRMINRIDATPHTCYAEPFIGMGGVFLRRPNRAKAEAINDRSRDVANLFRVVQRHIDALCRELEWRMAARDEFERLGAMNPETLTDIERAARFVFLQYNAFGGRPAKQSFRRGTTGPSNWSRARIEERLRAVAVRLEGVYIENLPYQDFIAEWDRPATLFYLDPPYWGCEDYYGKALFERDDFARLADLLRSIKGRYVMSINDVPDIRDLFAWARIEEEPITYSVNGRKPVVELVISGGGSP